MSNLPKDYISPTQINMYLRCPAQYYFRYILGMIIPPKSALTKGKAVHKGQEVNYKQKIETHEDMKLSDLQEVVATEFETLAPETEWQPDEDPGKIKDETISLASLYHTEIAPTVQPMLVEEEILIDIPGGKLKGYIDLVDMQEYIRDTKTASRTPSQDVISKSLQLSAYALAYRKEMDREENGVKLDYLVNTKTPKVVTLEGKRTEQDLQRFVSIATRVMDAIQKGVFYPNQDNFMCDEKNCGYWHECHKTL